MGFTVALGNIKQLSIGRFEFRKRIPERHRERIGQGEFKRVFHALTAAEIAREHARVLAEYEAILAGRNRTAVKVQKPAVSTAKSRQNTPKKTFAEAVALYEQDKLDKGRNVKGSTTLILR